MTLEDLLASNGVLPSIPKVIALLLNALDQPEPDLRKISELINTDPVLTSRVLQLANSARFQWSSQIGSVSQALALMGLNHIRDLAIAAAVAGAFRMIAGLDMHQFWRYSLNVAKLSRTLAGMVQLDQPVAFTAGLVHAIGELVLRTRLPEEMVALDQKTGPYSLRRAGAERKLLGFSYADVGAAFARSWLFPTTIADALHHQGRPFENGVYEPIAGILHLAVWRARAKESDYDAQDLIESFPDVVALALGIDIDMALEQDPIDWTTRLEASIMV